MIKSLLVSVRTGATRLLRGVPGDSAVFGPIRHGTCQSEAGGVVLSRERTGKVREVLGTDTAFLGHFGSFRTGRIKERSVSILPRGRYWGRGWGSVISGDDVLQAQLSPCPGFSFGDDLSGHDAWRQPFLPPCRMVEGNVAVLNAPCAENFHHWLLDTLPRAGMLVDAGWPVEKWDAAIVPRTLRAWHREALGLLGLSDDRWIPADESLHVRAGTLLAPSWSEPGRDPEHFDYTPEGLEWVRNLFLSGGRVDAGPRRILVSRERASARRLLPACEVEECLGRLGFVKVILEDLTLRQQAGLFAGAEAVVMPTGGNLANFVFCAPGTLVVEVFSPSYIPLFTPAFAATLGQRYLPLTGQGPVGAVHSDAGAAHDIVVDPVLLGDFIVSHLRS